MNLQHYNYYLVVDLEATCCDRGNIRKEEMEIIEIGAVMVHSESLSIVDEFQSFVKPIRHPILTEFCKSLTSIFQAQVDQLRLTQKRSHFWKTGCLVTQMVYLVLAAIPIANNFNKTATFTKYLFPLLILMSISKNCFRTSKVCENVMAWQKL